MDWQCSRRFVVCLLCVPKKKKNCFRPDHYRCNESQSSIIIFFKPYPNSVLTPKELTVTFVSFGKALTTHGDFCCGYQWKKVGGSNWICQQAYKERKPPIITAFIELGPRRPQKAQQWILVSQKQPLPWRCTNTAHSLALHNFHTQFQSNQQQLDGCLNPAWLEAARLIFQ